MPLSPTAAAGLGRAPEAGQHREAPAHAARAEALRLPWDGHDDRQGAVVDGATRQRARQLDCPETFALLL